MGSRGRDIRRAAGEGGHPPKVVGSGKGERASRVGEDKGTPHSHGRIPIAVLGSNQRQDHGRSLAAVGRATISTASRSLITRFDLLRSISPPPRETLVQRIGSKWTKSKYWAALGIERSYETMLNPEAPSSPLLNNNNNNNNPCPHPADRV